MKWFAILNVIVWLLEKIAKDENNNGKPDIFEGGKK